MNEEQKKEFTIRPIELKDANAWVQQYHRHNKPVQGHRFSICAKNKEGKIVGVAIVGRPIARLNQNGKSVEILRVVTDGTKNANSFLYGACWRAAQALGYQRVLTYTLKTESGSSLRAVGWQKKEAHSGSWDRKERPRKTQTIQLQEKIRWEKEKSEVKP